MIATPARHALKAFAILFACLLAIPAGAHPAPFSYLNVDLRAEQIDGALTIHVIDLAHDLHMAAPEQLLDRRVIAQRQQAILALVESRLTLRTDRPLTLDWTGVTPAANGDAVTVSFRAPGRRPGALTVDPHLFPYDPQHQTFVNVSESGQLRQQWIFDKDSPARTYYLGTTAGAFAVMKTFIPSGIHHILIGPDHILFLVGLLLLGGSWRALVGIVTAFTIGHSITLSLAALNIVTPPAALIEPAIALSIIVIGMDNLLRGKGKDLRAFVAFAFGLIHGFGFANVLREFGLPPEALGWSLFSFNVGVELGQLAIVVLVTLVLRAIWRRSENVGKWVAKTGSLVVIAAGTYWFVERVFFPGGIV